MFDLVKQNVLTPDPPTRVNNEVQTGEIRSRGIELEGVASFDFGLDVSLAYTFLDAEITKSNVDGEQGNRPGQTAKHTASLWADYTIPEGDFAGLGFGAGVRYIGPSLRRQSRGSGRAGLYAGRRGDPLRMEQLQVPAQRQQHLRQGLSSASCFGETSCFYGERRTVFGTVTYRW